MANCLQKVIGGFYIDDFFIELPIVNINFLVINKYLVWYIVHEKFTCEERERERGGRERVDIVVFTDCCGSDDVMVIIS